MSVDPVEHEEDLGVPGEGFPEEEEMTEEEFQVRMSIFGLIAHTVLDAAIPAIDDGYADDESVSDALDDHLDMLDQLPTDTLMSHALLTLPDEYFYEA
jgi:hypothetical protein